MSVCLHRSAMSVQVCESLYVYVWLWMWHKDPVQICRESRGFVVREAAFSSSGIICCCFSCELMLGVSSTKCCEELSTAPALQQAAKGYSIPGLPVSHEGLPGRTHASYHPAVLRPHLIGGQGKRTSPGVLSIALLCTLCSAYPQEALILCLPCRMSQAGPARGEKLCLITCGTLPSSLGSYTLVMLAISSLSVT